MCLALPGRILEIYEGVGAMPFARVAFGAVTKEICIAYTPDAQVGGYLIVHAGFAIQHLDEVAARRTLELVDEESS